MTRTRLGRRAAVLGIGAVVALWPSAGLAQAGTDLCISIDGEVRVQMGTASCSSVAAGPGKPNRAMASAPGARAVAGVIEGDAGNTATASGEMSFASAAAGEGNTATASGDSSEAYALNGDGNTATASGLASRAYATNGNGNTATASGDGSRATARFGDDNTATASGDASIASAEDGDDNTAIAGTDGCEAVATGGDATATC